MANPAKPSLIARLKAAHEAATSGPWKYVWPEQLFDQEAKPVVAVWNALPEIIAALEAARGVLNASGFLDPEFTSDMFPDEYPALARALDALEKKG